MYIEFHPYKHIVHGKGYTKGNLNVYPLTVIELPSTLAGDPTKSLKHTKSGKETLSPLTIFLAIGMLPFIVETPYSLSLGENGGYFWNEKNNYFSNCEDLGES